MAKKVKRTKKKTPGKKKDRKKKVAKQKKPSVKKKTARAEKAKQKKLKTSPRKAKKTKKKTSLSIREKMVLEIKKKLLSQRETLLKEAEEALSILPDEINFPDMGDQASAETDRNFMLRLRDRERMLLKKIDEAVERIEKGSFGICDECGDEIDSKRLQVRPVTTLCINCKTRQEEEEKIAEGGIIT